MNNLQFIHAATFFVLAIFPIWVWTQRGFWLPRYVHFLAATAFLLGALAMWSLQQQGLGKPFLTTFLIMLMFPAIVYAVFVLYGGVKGAPEIKKEAEEPPTVLQQQNPFDDAT